RRSDCRSRIGWWWGWWSCQLLLVDGSGGGSLAGGEVGQERLDLLLGGSGVGLGVAGREDRVEAAVDRSVDGREVGRQQHARVEPADGVDIRRQAVAVGDR